jgi:hypothetical protein
VLGGYWRVTGWPPVFFFLFFSFPPTLLFSLTWGCPSMAFMGYDAFMCLSQLWTLLGSLTRCFISCGPSVEVEHIGCRPQEEGSHISSHRLVQDVSGIYMLARDDALMLRMNSPMHFIARKIAFAVQRDSHATTLCTTGGLWRFAPGRGDSFCPPTTQLVVRSHRVVSRGPAHSCQSVSVLCERPPGIGLCSTGILWVSVRITTHTVPHVYLL